MLPCKQLQASKMGLDAARSKLQAATERPRMQTVGEKTRKNESSPRRSGRSCAQAAQLLVASAACASPIRTGGGAWRGVPARLSRLSRWRHCCRPQWPALRWPAPARHWPHHCCCPTAAPAGPAGWPAPPSAQRAGPPALPPAVGSAGDWLETPCSLVCRSTAGSFAVLSGLTWLASTVWAARRKR